MTTPKQQARIDAAVAAQKAADDLVIAGLQASLNAAAQTITDQKSTMDLQSHIIDDQAAEIERLKALLDPPPAKMWIGCAGHPNEADFEAFDARVGPMQVRRTYEGNLPDTFAASQYAAADVGKRASWTSARAPWNEVAAGQWDDRIAAYARSWPVDHPGLLTYSHEPENDGGDPKLFVAATKRFYAVARPLLPAGVKIGPVSMGWTMDPLNHSTQRADYFDQLDASCMDFAGLDVYQPYHFPPAGNDSRWWPAPTGRLTAFLDWCKARGVPPAIGETACAQDTTGASGNPDGTAAKIEWVTVTMQAVKAAGGIAFCYFDTLVNHDLDPTALIEAQPEFAAAWRAATTAHA